MKLKIWIAAIGTLAIGVGSAAADGPRIGQVKTVSGEATILRDTAKLPARPGDPVYAKDIVDTGEHGSIGITFLDNTVFSTGPNSEIALDAFRFHSKSGENDMLAEMRRGTLSVVSGEIPHETPGALKIKTPTAVLGVRGTTFAVQVVGEQK
jgi:hypothetical protein